MPLTTATVSGFITKPDGSILESGIVVFTLSGVAHSDGYILNSQEVTVSTGVDGSFTVNLVPNELYEYPTNYDVTAYEYDEVAGKPKKGYSFGKIRVPLAGGDITDLLPVPDYGKTNSVNVIKGDDIHWQVVSVNDIKFPVDLSAATIECKFIHSDGTEYLATIDDTAAAAGKFVVSADTSAYLVGSYSVRIIITNGGLTKTQVGSMRVVA